MAVMVGYLLLLTLASFFAARRTKIEHNIPILRFVILIPAHNEERLLPGLLNSLKQMDYPSNLYEIHVVADNCSDQTALVAAQGGARVHVRTDQENPGKGPALNWLLERIWRSMDLMPQGEPDINAILILDADSIVSANFLSVMAAHLGRGERVVQAYYAVRDPGHSWSSGLRYAALAVLHFLRPQGRTVLGGSAGLKGNGMVFSRDILMQHEWSSSVTEDIELHMALVLNGERVMFAPDAIVYGEMPETLANSKTQHARWERGRLDMSRRYVPRLGKKIWSEMMNHRFKQAYLFFDAIMEHVILPFSILVGANLLLVLINLGFLALASEWGRIGALGVASIRMSEINLFISIGLLLGQIFYLIAGLLAVRAPSNIYLSLLYVPVYMVWKFVQYGQVIIAKGQPEWVRTRRNEG